MLHYVMEVGAEEERDESEEKSLKLENECVPFFIHEELLNYIFEVYMSVMVCMQ